METKEHAIWRNTATEMALCPDAATVFRVVSGEVCASLGGTVCDNFPEEMALTAKVRSHISADRLEGSAEMRRVIPFGCEYTVSRRGEFFDGAARFSVDVRAGSSGRLRNLELDPVEIRGAIRRIGIADAQGELQWQDAPAAETVIYDAPFAPLWIAVECADGNYWETGCGDDLWRHRPQMEGNSPRTVVTASRGGVTMRRILLALPEELELERRPWRWEYWIAWGRPAQTDAAEPVRESLPRTAYRLDAAGERCDGMCLLAAPVRSRLRDLVRKAQEDVELADLTPGCCWDASHAGRPNKKMLEHWDCGELLSYYLWACRRMREKGKFFRVKVCEHVHPALAGALRGIRELELF